MRLSLILTTLLLGGQVMAAEIDTRHWSLRPRTRPDVPSVVDPWVRTPVDAFVLTRLTREKLRPAADADPMALIRRVTFDLTGLPPTPDEVRRFVEDHGAKPQAAYEALVDRLLASPRYGEKWGRHWLDVVRFAETEGFEYDRLRTGAWRYRDYVIDSFNADTPFDRFLTEQLAGDESDPDDKRLQTAAGFLRLGPVRRNAGNQELAFSRHEVLTEMTDVIGVALLGLTVGCARCHDHKFDDVAQADYYRMQAFLAATQEHDVVFASAEKQAEWKTTTDRLLAEIKELKRTLASKSGDDRRAAEDELRKLEKSLPPPLDAINTVRHAEAQRTAIHVLKRGDVEKKGPQVGPRPPAVIAASAELAPDVEKPRTALARWVTSPDNPLTARVIVNRVWGWHFGRGLVETANDLGSNGGEPSHPELLDWLTNEFVAGGWRIKSLHRLILLSSVYRQTSRPDDDRLLSHFPRRRLSAEEIRDAMLAVSGRLNVKAGGPSVILPVDPDQVKLLYSPTQWVVTPDAKEHDRRSVYLIAKRNLRLPFMEAFDQPDAATSCSRRETSTHALQSLELMNGRTSNDLAEAFAERLRREAGPDSVAQIDLAYRLVAGRSPNSKEKALAVAFLKEQPLREFALATFNLNPFLYVD